MSQQNVEIVRRVFAAGAEDLDAIIALHHPDWEGYIPAEYPISGTWRGLDGVRGFVEEWLGAFDQFSIEAEEFIDHDDAVFVAVAYTGRGLGSEVTLTDKWFYVYRVRDGKVYRWQPYRTRPEALEAIGLDE